MGRVLITGGASGFGQALATHYARTGHRVLVTDLAHDAPGGVLYRPLDVRDDEAWSGAVRWIDGNWDGLDLLVNNAGVAAGGRFDSSPVDDWEWLIDTNLMGVVRGCRAFMPMFKSQRGGRIVNVASMAGLVHPPGMSSYNAAKAAVVALSETMLHELAPYGVGVSVVCVRASSGPTWIRTCAFPIPISKHRRAS
jgi:NAD(P)-dependent dehydrogenase (short-subunit alcohol dehydrogenase family)